MLGKLWKWLGLADVEEEEDEQQGNGAVPFMFNAGAAKTAVAEKKEPVFEANRKNEYRSTGAVDDDERQSETGGVNIAVIQPQHFEDSQRAVDYIKRSQQVVLDCSQSTPEVSRRVIDFVSGAVYAVNGQAKPVGNGVFIFVPANTEIS